jgi:arabinofuranosyltransferase
VTRRMASKRKRESLRASTPPEIETPPSGVRGGGEGSTSSAIRSWDLGFFVFALFILGWLFWRNTMLASRLIDGTRYFLLDDDMMISMRYARNLAEGNGLVWNPGERVEGYTNFLWTVVMAGIHFLPHTDATIALLVKGVNFGLTAATLWLSVRFVRLFVPHSRLVTPLLLVVMVTCCDVLLWSVWGFEVALVSFLNVFFFYRIAQNRHDPLTYVALALIPLTRGDGVYVFAGNALVAFALTNGSRKTIVSLAVATLPTIAHFLFRHSYYGDWFPNTYYLKVHGLEEPFKRGSAYARNFLTQYSVMLVLAAASALSILRKDRRGFIPIGAVVPTLGWVVLVGGDMFIWYRFFAHVVPIVIIFAIIGAVTLARGVIGQAAWAAVVFVVSFPIIRPLERLVFLDTNGDPLEQIQVAMLLKKNARPDSSVAVITAGIVPYFTRLKAIDILGKSDKHIARLQPFKGAMVGHGKLDPPYTLGKDPDLVISCRSKAFTAALVTNTRTHDPVLSFLASQIFQQKYRPNPINEEFTLGRTTIYTWSGSNEFAHRGEWQSVHVTP